jgi:hypothetical protein
LLYNVPLDDAARIGVQNYLMGKYAINGVTVLKDPSGETGRLPGREGRIAWIRPQGEGAAFALRLAREGRYGLRIVDCRGASVRLVEEGQWEAGPRMAEWDGRTESGEKARPGIYVAEVRDGSAPVATRMFVLR